VTISEIDVREVARRRAAGEPMVLLDVREADELALASIPWATWIPMADVPVRSSELPAGVPIYVLCHAGVRSAYVTQYLLANGYPNAVNVAGGISAWSSFVDPTVPEY